MARWGTGGDQPDAWIEVSARHDRAHGAGSYRKCVAPQILGDADNKLLAALRVLLLQALSEMKQLQSQIEPADLGITYHRRERLGLARMVALGRVVHRTGACITACIT
jgi:hypothetical protein